MNELETQLAALDAAMAVARRLKVLPNQKRLHVISQLRITQDHYRRLRSYTVAMWLRHLVTMCECSPTIAAVRDDLALALVQPPASNTGVNSPVPLPMNVADVVNHGV